MRDDPGMDSLRENIRRLMAGRSEKAIAEAAKIDQSWLNRVMNPAREDGIKSPRESTLRPLAGFFGVTTQELMFSKPRIGEEPPRSYLSQPARLNPQMMAEALVAVRKAQEKDRRQFMPRQTAIALCAMYEIREMFPEVMTKADLDAFDRTVLAALDRAWERDGQEQDGRTGAGSSESDTRPAKKRNRA
jgi:transcriptional regulator with XRE-family HTH domain